SSLLLYCGCVVAAGTSHKSSRRFPFPLRDISDALGYPAAEVDLLRRVRPGVDASAEGIRFAAGDPESGPSLSLEFGPRADARFPYRLVLPSVLFRDFALHAVFRPYRAGRDQPGDVGFSRGLSQAEREAGEEFLFAVLNPSETVVQLGLALGDGDTRVTLYYTDVSMHLTSQRLASFRLPPQATGSHGWLRLSVTATGNEVSLQLLNCTTLEDVRLAQHVTRIPKELAFDGASTLYLAQAGPILGGRFVGRLQTLRLFSVPVLVPLCQDTIGFQNDAAPAPWSEPLEHRQPLRKPAETEPWKRSVNVTAPQSIKGEKGDMGRQGPPGYQGVKGEKGEPGAKGEPAVLAGIDPDLLFPQETKATRDAEAEGGIQVPLDRQDHPAPRYGHFG
ncbi:unnamed protein product, partial [Ixodes hexagonus]